VGVTCEAQEAGFQICGVMPEGRLTEFFRASEKTNIRTLRYDYGWNEIYFNEIIMEHVPREVLVDIYVTTTGKTEYDFDALGWPLEGALRCNKILYMFLSNIGLVGNRLRLFMLILEGPQILVCNPLVVMYMGGRLATDTAGRQKAISFESSEYGPPLFAFDLDVALITADFSSTSDTRNIIYSLSQIIVTSYAIENDNL